MKKLFSIFSVALFAVVLLFQNAVTVDAADPTTYYVQYDSDKDEWYYQIGSSWDDTVPPPKREIYYMLQDFKDGDYVVVESTEARGELKLDYHLGNLTVMPNSTALITCKSIAEYYQLHDSTVSLTADVEKACVYDNAVCNFNKNVNYLQLIYDEEPNMAVHVVGTCNEFWVHNTDESATKYHLWEFKDELIFNETILKTPYGTYNINPPATPAAPIVPDTTTSTAPTPAPAPSTPADEYDDVPKTGESTAYLWMFALAALCFAGSYSFKKRS